MSMSWMTTTVMLLFSYAFIFRVCRSACVTVIHLFSIQYLIELCAVTSARKASGALNYHARVVVLYFVLMFLSTRWFTQLHHNSRIKSLRSQINRIGLHRSVYYTLFSIPWKSARRIACKSVIGKTKAPHMHTLSAPTAYALTFIFILAQKGFLQ